jgi:hypothetical protein
VACWDLDIKLDERILGWLWPVAAGLLVTVVNIEDADLRKAEGAGLGGSWMVLLNELKTCAHSLQLVCSEKPEDSIHASGNGLHHAQYGL